MILEKMEQFLAESEFDYTLQHATEEHPLSRLLVFLGESKDHEERILEITAQEQILNQELTAHSPFGRYYKIQFTMTFPFKAKDETLNQVGSLVLFLNQMLDLPGFEVDELYNRISYRYVLMAKEEGIDNLLVTSLIGVIMMIFDLFTDPIKQVAKGQVSFNDLLEEIATRGKDLSLS